MARFSVAIETVLAHEGGFVDHPSDPGGATNWGISSRFLRSIDDSRDVRDLTKDAAEELYFEHYWKPHRYHLLGSQAVATKALDLTVNMGAEQAGKLIQRACMAHGASLKEDGVVGPKTRAAVAAAFPLLPALRSEAAGFYRTLVAGKPSMRPFLKGWLRRAYS